uniref:Uncharacterized protein n=1 Tax=Anguilla anguilla TaxID=7936 RepID=A0A0E9R404_ANGAN
MRCLFTSVAEVKAPNTAASLAPKRRKVLGRSRQRLLLRVKTFRQPSPLWTS